MSSRGSNWLSLVVAVMLSGMVVVVVTTPSTPDNYLPLKGHQIWEVRSAEAAAVVARLEGEGLADVLGYSTSSLKFRIFPESRLNASDAFLEAGAEYEVLVSDLEQHSVDLMKPERREASSRSESCTSDSCPRPFFEAYMTFEQMEWYLQEVAATYPRVSLLCIGTSHEGRGIWMVKIQSAEPGEPRAEPRAVWLEGGIHAREWISPAVALNIIDKAARSDTYLPPGTDLFVAPMANPDGYVYSWTSDRYWRKNMRQNDFINCPGVNLNRNWDEHFGVAASGFPCSNIYPGPNSFSEPETIALSNQMTIVSQDYDFRVMVALHSYGQILLYPWGWTTDDAPFTGEMKRVGRAFAKAALKPHGTVYGVSNSAAGLYLASGTTDDWAKGQLGVKYSYTLELPDEGEYGFTLPADRIRFVAKEARRGIRRIIRKACED